tara:strand:- start:155 stop:283 length:129 start_codon:yes stop_codon:yes gene_type:complete
MHPEYQNHNSNSDFIKFMHNQNQLGEVYDNFLKELKIIRIFN